MGPTRLATALAFIAITALAAPVTVATASPTAGAEPSARPSDPADPLVPMVEVRVSDFVAEAAELPPQLEQALQRDSGISGAEWLAQAEANAVGIEVLDALRDHVDVRAARLDGLELVVTVGTLADAAVVESVGARAEIGPVPDRMGEPIEGLVPVTDLRGGMPYIFPNGAGTARCSIGFVGIDVSTLQSQMLTAGHCEGDSGSARTATAINIPTNAGGSLSSPTQYIGNAGLHVTHDYPNPGYVDGDDNPITTFYDLGLVPVTGSGWTPKPEIVTWGGGSTGGPLSSSPLVIRDAGPALAGATVCKSGATSGWTCGSILAVDVLATVGTPSGETECDALSAGYCVGSLVASICVRGGDSGGPAVVGTRAVGITSASTVASGQCNLGGTGVFATLYSGVAAYEQVFKVFPDWEPLIGLSTPTWNNGGINRFEGPLTGTLAHGGVQHDVTFELDLGGSPTDEVSSAGGWSIDIGAVPNGTRTYTAYASWGSGVQESTALTGRFLKAAANRLFAADRYGTSVGISQYQFPTPGPGGVPVVYLANGATFPDALSAGPAATLEGGPLLLTPSSDLPAVVAAELDRLNPQSIVIVGGTGVVSPAVAAAAAVYTTGPVVRLGGADRYATSRLIAQRMLSQGLATGENLWVATGANFPDALSAGAAAASQGVPILLVNGSTSTLDPVSAGFINDTLQSDVVYIAGGTGVVTEGIRIAIADLASTSAATRAGGADRFATSVAINQVAFPGSAPQVFLAYGFNFPDALSGSVVAGLRGGPLYITQTGCVAPAALNHILDLGPSQVTAFGGAAIVSDAARDLKSC